MYDFALERIEFAKEKGAQYEIFLIRNAHNEQHRDGQGGPTLIRFVDVFELFKQHEVTAYLGLNDTDFAVSAFFHLF